GDSEGHQRRVHAPARLGSVDRNGPCCLPMQVAARVHHHALPCPCVSHDLYIIASQTRAVPYRRHTAPAHLAIRTPLRHTHVLLRTSRPSSTANVMPVAV